MSINQSSLPTYPLKELPTLVTPHHTRVVSIQSLANKGVASSGNDEGKG